jgi:predicted site-specific integrase-resolvase
MASSLVLRLKFFRPVSNDSIKRLVVSYKKRLACNTKGEYIEKKYFTSGDNLAEKKSLPKEEKSKSHNNLK